MAKNNVIVVRAPEGVHVRIARRENAAEATHEVLASWEVGLFVKLFELHITRTLTAKYSEGTCWDWGPGSGWRELLPLTGQARLTAHLPTGEDHKVLVRRIGEMNLAVQEEEQTYSIRS